MSKAYDINKLLKAYSEVKEGGSTIQAAATKYGVPLSTLGDRVSGKTSLESWSRGPKPIFDDEQEVEFTVYLKKMASSGYGCSRRDVICLASEYAFELNLRKRDNPLGPSWYYSYMKRNPSLKLGKVKSKNNHKAKASLEKNVGNYFKNLRMTLEKHGLMDKPHLVYNISEKGLTPHRSPPKVVRDSSQSVTTSKGCITTVIASGNAMGNHIPPYFVFKGRRFHERFIQDGSPGVNGTVSPSGLSNSTIFKAYLTEHFMKYTHRSNQSQPLLIIYDGNKSHITLTPGILDWAKQNNIILFTLPAHTSHFLQPLDVACFRPFEYAFTSSKRREIRSHKKMAMNHTEVCKLACAAYIQALQPSNLISGFSKTGISPYAALTTIDSSLHNPSQPFADEMSVDDVDSGSEITSHSKRASLQQKKNTKLKFSTESCCCQCLQELPPICIADSFDITWVQCDTCNHWVHLGLCVPHIIVDDNSKYICPCCKTIDCSEQ